MSRSIRRPSFFQGSRRRSMTRQSGRKLWVNVVQLYSISLSVRRLPPIPTVGRPSSMGGPCLSLASWPAFLWVASVQSEKTGRGVNGFGSFCRNKRTSAVGPKPGTGSFSLLTKRKVGNDYNEKQQASHFRQMVFQTCQPSCLAIPTPHLLP